MAILFNLGCKLNQYEGFCLKKKYQDQDDVIIINTCCVTKEAEARSVRRFAQLLKRFPDKKIIATGCTCRLHPNKFAGAHLIIDNIARNQVIKDIQPLPDRSRFFLKIQDGCNGRCSFCVVSRIRDRIESKPLEQISAEINWAKSNGYKEVVLVGANIGLYGLEHGSSLDQLLNGLRQIRDLPRIRLSSTEPTFINRALINALKGLPFCRHFHIPIQSADEKVLKGMNRDYGPEQLTHAIGLISENFIDAGIGADIIVGFPAEGEAEFANTYRFVENNPFMHLHVFPYSPRPITEAYKLGDPVSTREKKNRLWRLRQLIRTKNYQFRKNLVNKILGVTIEKHNDQSFGLTDNYVRVRIDGQCRERDLVDVRIDKVTDEGTYGTVV